jgi:hypothetical protein
MALEPITPPLLRSSPVAEPYIPSSPAGHLPLLSDPSSLLSDDIRAAEEAVFQADTLLPAWKKSNNNTEVFDATNTDQSSSNTPVVHTLSNFLNSDTPVSSSPRVKVADQKVEVPITPHRAIAVPGKFTICSEIVEEMLLDEDSTYGDSPSDTPFQKAMQAAAENVKRWSEQEQLHEADVKSRVDVPKIDFALPDAAWKPLQSINHDRMAVLAAQRKAILQIEEEYGFSSNWIGAGQLKLSWLPWDDNLAKVALDESFGDANDLEPYLIDSIAVVDSSSLTWKPPGVRILKPDDDEDAEEDELELGYFTEKLPQDVTSLVRKRKMQYEEEKKMNSDHVCF